MKELMKFLFKRQWLKILIIVFFTYVNVESQLNVLDLFPIIAMHIKKGLFNIPSDILFDVTTAIILSIIASIVISYLSISVASKFAYDLKEKLFEILLNLKTIEDLNRINYSGLMTRLIRGVDTEQSFVLIIFRRVLLIVVACICIAINLYSISQWSSFAFMVFVLIFAFIFIFRLNQLSNLYFKVKKLYGKLNALFLDKISGLKVIKLFSKEEHSNNIFKNEADNAYEKGFRFQYKLNFSLIWLITVDIILMAFLFNVIYNYSTGASNIDNVIFVSLYIVYLINHLYSLAPFVSIYPLSYTSAVRIEEVLALEKISSDYGNENNFDGIEFKNVSLTLSDRQILSDISFKIPDKSKTLIVGPIASGKTSLVYSMMGFHNIDSGEILIDRNAKVSLTTNKVFLFKDSVFENIALGDNNISREDALNACNDALFTKDLAFEVNENGNNLTLDLKQRLTIARALAHDYDLYIFDNAFTSIDSASKKIIKENIERRLENKTVIYIDNDFEDNSYFDNILVLDNGKIISQGKHDELIKTCDTYKKLFNESRGCNDGTQVL